MYGIDLNKMSLDEVLEYCKERDKWALQLLIDCDGYVETCCTLIENGKI